jgi:hypothetical protein
MEEEVKPVEEGTDVLPEVPENHEPAPEVATVA